MLVPGVHIPRSHLTAQLKLPKSTAKFNKSASDTVASFMSIMARSTARVRECRAKCGNVKPVVSGRVQCQFQNSVRRGIAYFHVGIKGKRNCAVLVTTGTGDDLANAVYRVRSAVRILGNKARIEMDVAVNHQISPRILQSLP